jgi:hypothetical protein
VTGLNGGTVVSKTMRFAGGRRSIPCNIQSWNMSEGVPSKIGKLLHENMISNISDLFSPSLWEHFFASLFRLAKESFQQTNAQNL